MVVFLYIVRRHCLESEETEQEQRRVEYLGWRRKSDVVAVCTQINNTESRHIWKICRKSPFNRKWVSWFSCWTFFVDPLSPNVLLLARSFIRTCRILSMLANIPSDCDLMCVCVNVCIWRTRCHCMHLYTVYSSAKINFLLSIHFNFQLNFRYQPLCPLLFSHY